MRHLFLLLLLLPAACTPPPATPASPAAARIMPWESNPRYWAWDGTEPVLLLGAGSNDNLFQSDGFVRELDELAAAGGNFVRCTMSSRDTLDDWPFAYDPARGKYRLDRFATTYWDNFRAFVAAAAARDIVVQIEVWDRFDFSRGPWKVNPFNPALTEDYPAATAALLAADYPLHPSSDVQPFFHSIPGMPRYAAGLDTVRAIQETFVRQLLSVTLPYGNVLYCINNETTTPVAWGHYWADFIHREAAATGRRAYVTDMFDHFYTPGNCPKCQAAVRDTLHYDFLDVSQINSRHFGRHHWDTLLAVRALARQGPARPVNCTKVYGGGESSWGSGTNADGIARFNRDVLGGIAAVRHHRPPSGNGINGAALASIRGIRTLERHLNFWDLAPDTTALATATSEAYAARDATTGALLIYLPTAGAVTIRHGLRDVPIRFTRIGYLGTQRSETLQPPYRDTFRLFTEEERGGWMLLQPGESGS